MATSYQTRELARSEEQKTQMEARTSHSIVESLIQAHLSPLLENKAKETNYLCHSEVFLNAYMCLNKIWHNSFVRIFEQNIFRHK